MIDYLASFVNTDGASFPDTLGKNATGPAATDGTEFVKLYIDDQWGARQALMDEAGLTPDSVSEAPGTSQMVAAMRIIFGGPGEVVQYHKNNDPSVNGDRVLILNGQGILRANFALLDTAVYVGDGNNATASKYYHADDAAGVTRNTAGVYLILPETRGYAPRGLDTAASVDPDGATRDLASIQASAIWGHHHEVYSGLIATGAAGGAADYLRLDITPAAQVNTFDSSDIVRESITDGVNGTPLLSSESRMTNFATIFGIRY